MAARIRVEDPELRRHRRRERYKRREIAYEVSQMERVRHCGRRLAVNGDGIVRIVAGPHGSGFTGLAYCGSVWACACCSAVIRQRRAEEIDLAVRRQFIAGGGMLFLTITVPHTRHDKLADTIDRVRAGWQGFRRNREGREQWASVGAVGSIAALEITEGRNGFHPHLHVLVFTEQPVSTDAAAAFGAVVEAEVIATARRRGWPLPRRGGVGVDTQVVRNMRQAGRYVAKVWDEHGTDRGPGLELARGDLKAGRRTGQLTPFELLDGYDAAVRKRGNVRSGRRWCAKWRAYEAATKGRRAVVWSKGLKARFGIVDLDDEDIANEIAHEGAVEDVSIDRETWWLIVVYRLRAKLLDEHERHGVRGALAVIAEARRRYVAVTHDPLEDIGALLAGAHPSG